MSTSPQTKARQTAIALVKEAKAAGWLRAVIKCKPDGTVQLDASMSVYEGDDNFNTDDLRMGE